MLEKGLLIIAFLTVSCTARDSSLSPAASEVLATARELASKYATQTNQPTLTPTEVPFEGVVLPEGSGTLRNAGELWFFYSPLVDSEIGKDVPVQIVEHTYEDGTAETWIALVEHSEWPLFVRNEAGEWETALEYVEVKRPLVNVEGIPMPLSCEFWGPNHLNCFLVANAPVFVERDVEYLPMAISLDGRADSPMYVNLNVPLQRSGTANFVNLLTYQKGVYVAGHVGARGLGNGFRLSSLSEGDVFWLDTVYDLPDLDGLIERFSSEGNTDLEFRAMQIKENREKIRQVFSSILLGRYDRLMQARLDLWASIGAGIGKY